MCVHSHIQINATACILREFLTMFCCAMNLTILDTMAFAVMSGSIHFKELLTCHF